MLRTLKSNHIKDFTIHKTLNRIEKLYQMEIEVVVEFCDFSKCEQVCNLLVEKLDETVRLSSPVLYHTASKLDSLRYVMVLEGVSLIKALTGKNKLLIEKNINKISISLVKPKGGNKILLKETNYEFKEIVDQKNSPPPTLPPKSNFSINKKMKMVHPFVTDTL